MAKGGGILLVVIGHTLGGLIDSPLAASNAALRLVFLGIYIVHMPLFFLLSGFTVQRRLERGWQKQLSDLAITIAWPYFLWSAIQYSVIFAAGSLVNSPVAHFWQPLLNLPVSTISQFWFLYILFFLHLAAMLLVPRIGARGFLGLAIAGRIAFAVFGMATMPRLFVTHGLFYALGLWLGTQSLEKMRGYAAGRLWLVLTATAVALVAETASVWLIAGAHAGQFATLESRELAVLAWHLPILPTSFAATLASLLLSMRVRGWLAEALAFLGQRSMAIFVLHVLFIAGSRIALTRIAHIHETGVLLVVGVGLGLVAPLLIHAVAKRFGMARAVGLGG